MFRPSKYCYDIHHNLAIDYLNSSVSIGPCCQSGRITIPDTDIDTMWNNPTLIKIRVDNNSNILSEEYCKTCTSVEAANIKSRRIGDYELFEPMDPDNKKILSLDVKLGNLCNLKCTICGPESSSSWITDAQLLGIAVPGHLRFDKQYNKDLTFGIKNTEILRDLRVIKFWGGEPLLNEKHAEFLEFLNDVGVLKNCRVMYNTNATQRVSQRVLDIWKKANLVEIYFSIDDTEQRFEFQRFGASWDSVVDNLNWYRDNLPVNHLLYIMCTLSYLNVCYLPELNKWKENSFDKTRLGDEIKLMVQPAVGTFGIESVPEKLKHFLLEKYKDCGGLSQYLGLSSRTAPTAENIIRALDRLDNIRQTNWRQSLPELANCIDDDKI